MRIGTWNLEGRWTPDHAAVMADLKCDVWLLTENQRNTELPGRKPGQASIDHIAVPRDWQVLGAARIRVAQRLSDHDAYWVEVER